LKQMMETSLSANESKVFDSGGLDSSSQMDEFENENEVAETELFAGEQGEQVAQEAANKGEQVEQVVVEEIRKQVVVEEIRKENEQENYDCSLNTTVESVDNDEESLDTPSKTPDDKFGGLSPIPMMSDGFHN
jgi:hypothetical protein